MARMVPGCARWWPAQRSERQMRVFATAVAHRRCGISLLPGERQEWW
jgi:hypothetical protein